MHCIFVHLQQIMQTPLTDTYNPPTPPTSIKQAAKNEHLLGKDMTKLADKLQTRVQQLEVSVCCCSELRGLAVSLAHAYTRANASSTIHSTPSTPQMELQRWHDRHAETLEAARLQIAREFESRTATAEARYAGQTEAANRRADTTQAALEAARAAGSEAESRVAALRAQLAVATEAAAVNAAARAAAERSNAGAESDLRAQLAAEKAASASAAERHAAEVAALREELRVEKEAGARKQRAAEEVHTAELAELAAKQQAAVAAASAATEAAAWAKERAAAEAELGIQARLAEQAEQLAAQHAEVMARAEHAAEAAAAAVAKAHRGEVEQLVAQLAAARRAASTAEEHLEAVTSQAAACNSDIKRQLEQDRVMFEVTQLQLKALRLDSARKRRSLLVAKKVVQEVREEQVAPAAAGEPSGSAAWASDEDNGDRAGGGQGQRRRGRPRQIASLEGSPVANGDRLRPYDFDPLSSDTENEGGDHSTSPSPSVDGYSAAASSDAEAGDTRLRRSAGAAPVVPPLALSPVRWLQQAVASPEVVRDITPEAKAMMLRHVISDLKWEAAGIMSERRSTSGSDDEDEEHRGGGGSSGGSYDGVGETEMDAAAGDGSADAGQQGAVRQLCASKNGRAADPTATDSGSPRDSSRTAAAAAAATSAAQQKRRRPLQPPQPQPTVGRPSSRLASDRQRQQRRSAAPSAVQTVAHSTRGWPEEYCAEPSADQKAALDAAILADMCTRREGEATKVTVEALVAALQGMTLRGVEWRRGAKKRHELVRDYLAWAAAHPVNGSHDRQGAAAAAAGGSSDGGVMYESNGGSLSGGSESGAAAAAAAAAERADSLPAADNTHAKAGHHSARNSTLIIPAAGGGGVSGVRQAASGFLGSIKSALSSRASSIDQQHSSRTPRQQHQSGKQPALLPPPPSSPGMLAVLSAYTDSPPPQPKLLSARGGSRGSSRQHHTPRADEPCSDGVCVRCAALAAAASDTGYKGVTMDDIFTQGSKRFCESQLPRQGRR